MEKSLAVRLAGFVLGAECHGHCEASEGFIAAFYADFGPAQAAAIRRAADLMRESQRDGSAQPPEGDLS